MIKIIGKICNLYYQSRKCSIIYIGHDELCSIVPMKDTCKWWYKLLFSYFKWWYKLFFFRFIRSQSYKIGLILTISKLTSCLWGTLSMVLMGVWVIGPATTTFAEGKRAIKRCVTETNERYTTGHGEERY